MDKVIAVLAAIEICGSTCQTNLNVVIAGIAIQVCMTTAFVQQSVVAITSMKLDIRLNTFTNKNHIAATAAMAYNLGNTQEYLLASTENHFNRFSMLGTTDAFDNIVFVTGALAEAAD